MDDQVSVALHAGRLQARSVLATGWRRWVAPLRDVLALMHQRRRQRTALSRLDGRLLDDIGVSADAARREVSKPPWQP